MKQLEIGDWVKLPNQDTCSNYLLEQVLFIAPEYISTESYQIYRGDVERVDPEMVALKLMSDAQTIFESMYRGEITDDKVRAMNNLLFEARDWKAKK